MNKTHATIAGLFFVVGLMTYRFASFLPLAFG